jgi:hypothetical protein
VKSLLLIWINLKEFDILKKAEDGQQLIKFIWVPFREESNAMISSIRHINIQNIF